ASPLIFNSINIIQPVGEVPTTEARGPTVEVIEEDQTLQRVIEVTRRNSNNDSTKFRAETVVENGSTRTNFKTNSRLSDTILRKTTACTSNCDKESPSYTCIQRNVSNHSQNESS
ncbi:hypothetical protein JYU34_020136, partial [Plutella xylostella]